MPRSIRGSYFASALDTPVKSRRSSEPMITGSRELWWLPMKMAGRAFQTFSSPMTFELDPGHRQRGVARQRDADVGAGPLVTAYGAEDRAGDQSPAFRPPSAPTVPRTGARPGGSAPDMSSTGQPCRSAASRSARPGGDRVRVAGAGEEGDVLVAVGVAVALVQVDVVLAGVAAHGLRLRLAPQELADHPAGEHAVLGLELRCTRCRRCRARARRVRSGTAWPPRRGRRCVPSAGVP